MSKKNTTNQTNPTLDRAKHCTSSVDLIAVKRRAKQVEANPGKLHYAVGQAETDIKALIEALDKIKNKAWDYTSPPMSEKVRVFAGIIHKAADQALTQKGGK